MNCFNLLLLIAQIVLPAAYSNGPGYAFHGDKKPLNNLEIVSGGNYHPQIPSNWRLVDTDYHKYASGGTPEKRLIANEPNFFNVPPGLPQGYGQQQSSTPFQSPFLEYGQPSNKPVQPSFSEFGQSPSSSMRPEGYVAVPVFRVDSQQHNSRCGAGRSLDFTANAPSVPSNIYQYKPQTVSEPLFNGGNLIYPNQYNTPTLPSLTEPGQNGWFSQPTPVTPPTPSNSLVLVPVRSDSLANFPELSCKEENLRESRGLFKESTNPTPGQYNYYRYPQTPTLTSNTLYQPSPVPHDFSIAFTRRSPVTVTQKHPDGICPVDSSPSSSYPLLNSRDERATITVFEFPHQNDTSNSQQPSSSAQSNFDQPAQEEKTDNVKENSESTDKSQNDETKPVEETQQPNDEPTAPTTPSGANYLTPEDKAMTTLLIDRMAAEIKACNKDQLVMKEMAVETPNEKMGGYALNLVATDR